MYAPMAEILRKKQEYDIFARIRFKMYPELRDEFGEEFLPDPKKEPKDDWHEKYVEVECKYINNDKNEKEPNQEYQTEVEYPYGDIVIDYFAVTKGKKPG